MSVARFASLFLIGLTGLFLSTGIVAGQESKAKVDVVGLSLIKPDPDNEFGGSSVMGRSPGVEVTLRIRDEKAFFISVVDDEDGGSKVAILTDKDVTLEDESSSGRLGFMSDISDDGTTVTVPVSASQLPPGGTQLLHVKGSVTLVAGTNPKTDTFEFAIVEDAEVKLGAIATHLKEVEEDPFGETGWGFTFESKQSFDAIREIQFLDENGEEIESNSTGRSSFGFNNNMTYSQGYMIQAKPKKVTVKVSYFESTEKIKVPVDLPVGLGLGD